MARFITNFVERYQNCSSTGFSAGSGRLSNATQQAPDIQRVDPVAEHHDRGRSHHDRRQRGERDGRDPGVGERLQEVHREEHHHRHRQRDGGRGEQHRAAGRGHGPRQRLLAPGAGRELVAVAADHQQGVVDRQRQTHRGGQVQREDRDVGEERGHPQHGEGSEDGHHADRERQRGGEQAAEHPDEYQEAERDDDRLHQQQVVLRLFGDLDVDHRGAAGADHDPVAVPGDLLHQRLGVALLHALRADDAGDDETRLLVLADQRGGCLRRRCPRRGDGGDMAGSLELVDHVGGRRAGLADCRSGQAP